MKPQLRAVLEELRKTHRTIVERIGPLWKIADHQETFKDTFKDFYHDFCAFHDSQDFNAERTHCHTITEIQDRMQRRKSVFSSEARWQQLHNRLQPLREADDNVIERYYVPFMARFRTALDQIYALVDNNTAQAIAETKALLSTLKPEYDRTKAKLTEMTNAIGALTSDL
jgi:hypothetical protein